MNETNAETFFIKQHNSSLKKCSKLLFLYSRFFGPRFCSVFQFRKIDAGFPTILFFENWLLIFFDALPWSIDGLQSHTSQIHTCILHVFQCWSPRHMYFSTKVGWRFQTKIHLFKSTAFQLRITLHWFISLYWAYLISLNPFLFFSWKEKQVPVWLRKMVT